MNNEKLLRLVSLANALTAQASALSNAILACVNDEQTKNQMKTRKAVTLAATPKKPRRKVKRTKKAKAIPAKEESKQ